MRRPHWEWFLYSIYVIYALSIYNLHFHVYTTNLNGLCSGIEIDKQPYVLRNISVLLPKYDIQILGKYTMHIVNLKPKNKRRTEGML